jgi:glucose-1-phosphate thymidylyltransferase
MNSRLKRKDLNELIQVISKVDFMKVVMLSGGFATRLRPLTNERAKPLLPIADKPLIERVFDKYDIEEVPYVTTNRKFASQFRKWREEYQRNVHLIIEETHKEAEKLGAVGALGSFIKKEQIEEDLLVVAGDNIFPFNLSDFVRRFDKNPLIALYDFHSTERVRRKYGVVTTDEQGKIRNFQEKPVHPQSTLVSIGCYLYPQKVLPLIDQFISQVPQEKDAPGYFNEWLCEHMDMDSYVSTGKWYDIGDLKSYIEASLDFAHSENYISESVTLENTPLDSCVIFPHVILRNCALKECIVDSEVTLSGVTLENCIVGERTEIRRIE